jgi:two-component system, NtrC family, response regulator AtoC
MNEDTTGAFSHDPGAHRLVVVWEGGSLARAIPRGVSWTIGRGAECDVRIDHRSVSRRHVLLRAGERVTLEELGSANGTRLRGQVVAAGKPVVLCPGDVVEVGAASLIFQGPAEAQGAPLEGGAGSMKQLSELVSRVAPSLLSVHFFGETGVGKEVLSRSLHQASRRASGPFVAVNCAALPETLVESELFGHEKGAFTGADRARKGLLEEAHGGTLLLDEVGELPLRVQAKLLRVLEAREVQRLGASAARSVDLRLVSASNRDLRGMVASGDFREDLFHRIVAISLFVPPLRERLGEIMPLARVFSEAAARDMGRAPPVFSFEAVGWLESQPWTGNIRELKNRVECAVLLCNGKAIELSHLVPQPGPAAQPRPEGKLRDEWQALERARILEALARSGDNQSAAARALGISRRTLITRLEEYSVARPRKK